MMKRQKNEPKQPLKQKLEEASDWHPSYPEADTEHAPVQEIDPRQTQPMLMKLVHQRQEQNNTKKITKELTNIDGFIATAVVNVESGVALASIANTNDFDIEQTATAHAQIVKTKYDVLQALGLKNERIEDILMTLDFQYHLISPSIQNPSIFIYLALDKATSNLAMSRYYLQHASRALNI